MRARVISLLLLVGGLAGIGYAASGAVGLGGSAAAPAGPRFNVVPTATPTPAPRDPPWIVRAPVPSIGPGPRRIGIQAGHWQTDEVPDELARLKTLGGALWGNYTEWELDLDIARRVKQKLEATGLAVDLLPATVPADYVADVFVAIHADGDDTETARGFKVAHGVRRGPFEDGLVEILSQEYWKATDLPVDPNITEAMTSYYAFRWERFEHAVNPHVPSVIIETGFLTSAADRKVLLLQTDRVATGIANGVIRFLSEVPRAAEFRDDLVLPKATPEPSPTP